ncbi:MAG TPA: hypothetical protein VG228_09905 [Solirubrobacteraceae bacterium]|jgi:hypothetical protein|nr:hypothetical protein [Solirubrobacteraceae bacterium]
MPSAAGAATTYSVKWAKSVPLLNPNDGGGLDAAACAPAAAGTKALLCLAGDVRGDIFATNHPAQAASQWLRRYIDPKTAITGISCPSAQLCVAVDASGRVMHSTNPIGSVADWTKPVRIDSTTQTGGGYAGFSSVDCPTTSFCIAVDNGASNQIAYTTNPTGPASAWTLTTIGNGVLLDSVSCASTALCLVGGSNVYYAAQPTGGASAWKATAALSSSNSVVAALSCDTVKLCVGVGYGNAGVGLSVSSAAPATTTWSQGLIGADPPAQGAQLIDSVACPERNFCVAVDGGSNAYTSVTPVRGAWTNARPLKKASQSSVSQVACNTAVCVEVDNRGTVTYGAIHSGTSTTKTTTSTSTTTTPTSTKTTTTSTGTTH